MKYRNVAIEREYGSGGREIASKVAERLGVKCYGKEILMLAAKESGIPPQRLEQIEESTNDTVWDSMLAINKMMLGGANGFSEKSELAVLEAKIIQKIADRESCVFLGRGAGFLLGDKKDTLSIFIHADYEFRKNHAVENYGIDESDADKMMKLIDKRRSNYYSAFRKMLWGEKEGYDLVLNSGKLGIDKCVDIIVNAFGDSE